MSPDYDESNEIPFEIIWFRLEVFPNNKRRKYGDLRMIPLQHILFYGIDFEPCHYVLFPKKYQHRKCTLTDSFG